MSNTLTIELPPTARIPEQLRDANFVRYVLAGALYARGMVSGREARALTGDSRRVFEETMAELGQPMLPDDPTTASEELDAL